MMKRKIYSTPIKLAALLLVLCSLAGMAIYGYYSGLGLFLQCYQDDTEAYPYYNNALCWNAMIVYENDAMRWEELNAASARTYHQKDQLEQLNHRLSTSSLWAVHIQSDANGQEQATVIGRTGQITVPKTAAKFYYDTLSETSGYQLYIDTEADTKDVFTECREQYRIIHPVFWRYVGGLIACTVFALAGWMLLLITAGHRSAAESIVLCGVQRIPFDFSTCLFGLAGLLCCVLLDYNLDFTGDNLQWIQLQLTGIIAASLGLTVLFFLWTHLLCAQVKARILLRNTLCGRFCIRIWKLLHHSVQGIGKSSEQTQQPGASAEKLSGWARIRQGSWKRNPLFRILGRGARRGVQHLLELFRSINVIWKLCGVTAFVMLVLELFAFTSYYSGAAFLLMVLLDIVVFFAVGFFAMQLDRLKKGGQHLADGDLDYKIPTDRMYWDLQKHAQNLNSISEGMAVAVEERLKSERMKYELLTNVSHDIKTPLTSIINYIDLLHGEPIESMQAQEYIEVLERQAARLKKLITDLIEVSKATTGNITVHAARTHVGELLQQCMGEYSERFFANKLEPILSMPEGEASIYADGRLLWRVFDNLLGNIVKYALPGTRVYLNLQVDREKVTITLKNISREPLNIAPEELKERFVRGDSARATEGSGLGLSIASSLTELMGGQFELDVDGDLFKIILIFDEMPGE